MPIINHLLQYIAVYSLCFFILYQLATIISAKKLTTENKIVQVMIATGGGVFLPLTKTDNKVYNIIKISGKIVGWSILGILLIGVFFTFLHIIVAAISFVIILAIVLFFIRTAADGLADAAAFDSILYFLKKN